jgi:hypothetical protein
MEISIVREMSTFRFPGAMAELMSIRFVREKSFISNFRIIVDYLLRKFWSSILYNLGESESLQTFRSKTCCLYHQDD